VLLKPRGRIFWTGFRWLNIESCHDPVESTATGPLIKLKMYSRTTLSAHVT
jgi:hypothetical protein